MQTEDPIYQRVATRFHELVDITLGCKQFSEEEEREMEDICTIMDAFDMREYKPALALGGIDDMYSSAVEELGRKVVKIKEGLEQRDGQLNQYERHRLDAVNYFLSN